MRSVLAPLDNRGTTATVNGMGYVHEDDTKFEHEGWVTMTYADGKVSSGTSNGLGHYLEGYTYLPGGGGRIDPAFLRPHSEVTGWLPRCECGWVGVVTDVPESAQVDRLREPTGEQEDLLMGQWRLHLRDAIGAYPVAAVQA